jgi:hypothetical protein
MRLIIDEALFALDPPLSFFIPFFRTKLTCR